jgi:Lrp/AsnC family leucine-responsive transcriptional regulator
MDIYDKLNLDEKDKRILSLMQTEKDISQEELAKRISLSQPSVGARIRKLEDKGLLVKVHGINFKIANLFIAKVDVLSTNSDKVLNACNENPNFIFGMVTSGKYDLCLFFTATDIKTLEDTVNKTIRKNPLVKEVELNIVISTDKDLVLPIAANV